MRPHPVAHTHKFLLGSTPNPRDLELAHETLFLCRHGLNMALFAIKISLYISLHHVLVIPLIFIKH